MLLSVLALLASAQPPPQSPDDTLRALRREARRSAYYYEAALRSRLSTRLGGGYGTDCDEIIGRFCFHFNDRDSPASAPVPEPPEVGEARTVAIAVHRRWFGEDPADGDAAGALIRYLIEAERPGEAVAAARAHVWAADRDARSFMLLGLALHHHADFEAAEAAFDSARARLPVAERRSLDSVEPFLENAEARMYSRLDDAAREAYEARLWALADPFRSQPGNERRSAHYARHALSEVLAATPRARGMLSWGADHTEIVLRYGTPTRRERLRDFYPTLSHNTNLVESFDPHAISLVLPALVTSGIPHLPDDPATRSDLERDSARSVYAPVTFHRTRGMAAQVAVFPDDEGGTLTVTAGLPPDTLEPRVPVAPRALLVVLDTLGLELRRAPAEIRWTEDSVVVVDAAVTVPAGPLVYQLELQDDSTRLAGLVRHAAFVPAARGLVLSDITVAEPYGDSLPRSRDDAQLRPLPGTMLSNVRMVGLYAEVSGLDRSGGAARYTVEWSVEPAERRPALARAARWLGRQLGVVAPEQPVRVRWEDAGPRQVATVAFSLDLSPLEPGLHRIVLVVTDELSGESRTSSRVVRIPDEPGRRPPPSGS